MRFLVLVLLAIATLAVPYLLYTHHATLNDWLMGLFTYIIAVATVLALFQDWLRSLIWHAELFLTIEPKPPDSHKTSAYYEALVSNPDNTPATPVVYEAPCFYYRLRIHNRGRVAAREVEVYATEVQRKTTTNAWVSVERFIPQYLVWSLLSGRVYLPILPPKSARHCDLGHVLHPGYRKNFHPTEDDAAVPIQETILSLDVQAKALRRGHLLPKGEYRITLEVAASNTEPRTFIVFANNPGTWYDDEEEMLTKGTAVSTTAR